MQEERVGRGCLTGETTRNFQGLSYTIREMDPMKRGSEESSYVSLQWVDIRERTVGSIYYQEYDELKRGTVNKNYI